MSGTTPTARVIAADDGQPSPPSTPLHPVSRLVGPITLALGSLLAAVGMTLHLPGMAEDLFVLAIAETPTRWLASHLLMGFGFALVAVGAGSALARLRLDRGATLTAMGAAATALGSLSLALGDMAHGAVSFALTEVDPATSLAIHEVYFEHPAVVAINVGPPLMMVGMLVLGAGLLRSRAQPRWVGIVIMVSPIAVNAAFALGAPTLLTGVPFAIGISTFAYSLLRASDPHRMDASIVTRRSRS